MRLDKVGERWESTPSNIYSRDDYRANLISRATRPTTIRLPSVSMRGRGAGQIRRGNIRSSRIRQTRLRRAAGRAELAATHPRDQRSRPPPVRKLAKWELVVR